jgi:hypothetical protein
MPVSWKAALAVPLLLSAEQPAHGPIYSGMPPERFQGDFAAVVVFTSNVEAFCGDPGPGLTIHGCAGMRDGVPTIIIYSPCASGPTERFARIACHEGAHLQGWGGNHEL